MIYAYLGIIMPSYGIYLSSFRMTDSQDLTPYTPWISAKSIWGFHRSGASVTSQWMPVKRNVSANVRWENPALPMMGQLRMFPFLQPARSMAWPPQPVTVQLRMIRFSISGHLMASELPVGPTSGTWIFSIVMPETKSPHLPLPSRLNDPSGGHLAGLKVRIPSRVVRRSCFCFPAFLSSPSPLAVP